MRLKQGASLENVSWQMFYAAIIVDGIMEDHDSEAIITSGADGQHKAQSKHYPQNNASGMVEALDFRTFHLADPERVAQKIRERLGSNYDVVLESTHLHIEYDPKT